MSEQETLRLVAEVVDKYSGPMKEMLAALKKLGEGAKDVHEKGAKQTNQHEKAYRDLRDQLLRVKDTTSDVLRPAFMALGVTVLSVAGSIAAVSEAVKNFGDYGQKLEYAHRASGLLTGTLRGLAEANEAFGGSAENTIRSLESFGDHMKELGRFAPEYLNQWKKFILKDGHTLFDELGKSLMTGTTEDKLRKAMDFIPKIRDVDQRRQVLALLGLPENWAYLTDKEFAEMRKRAEDFNKRFPFDPERAAEAKKAWEDFFTTMRGYQSEIAQSGLGRSLVDALKGMEDLLRSSEFQGLMHELQLDAETIGKMFGEWKVSDALKEDLEIIHGTLKLIRETIEWIQKNWYLAKPDEAKKSIQDKFGAFGLGSSSLHNKEQKDAVKEGTKEGLTDFFNSWTAAQKLAGGYTPMAYHPDGGGEFGPGGGRVGPGSMPRTFRFGNREYPNVGSPGGGGTPRGAPSVDKNPDGSNDVSSPSSPDDVTGINRDWQRQQLDANPALKEELYRRSLGENSDPLANQAIMEEAANRADIRRKLHGGGGFASHDNLEYFQGYYRGTITAKMRKMLDDNYRKVFVEGSDVSRGAIDNSSNAPGNPLAARNAALHRFKDTRPPINGEHFEIPDRNESGTGERDAYPGWRAEQLAEAARRHGPHLRDFIARGHGAHRDAEALRRVLRGADAGDSMRGSAHLTVDLNGLPKGTRTSLKTGGQLFKQVTLNRGRPMNSASES